MIGELKETERFTIGDNNLSVNVFSPSINFENIEGETSDKNVKKDL
jgi:hypothetical protein